MTHIKWPFLYTAKYKRTSGFLIKQIFLEELPIVLLVFAIFAQPLDLRLFVTLGLLFAAMISVYEIGYAENDRVGARKEAAPKLTENFSALGKFVLAPYAWGWAILLTVLGVLILGDSAQISALERVGLAQFGAGLQGDAVMVLIWVVMMAISQLVFAVFNLVPLVWRVFVYVPLHVSKYLAPAVFLTTGLAGMVLLFAHIVRTWSLYAVRRAGGDMEFLPSQFIRLVFLLLGLGLLSVCLPMHEVWSAWQTWLILGFCGIRAAPELLRKMR